MTMTRRTALGSLGAWCLAACVPPPPPPPEFPAIDYGPRTDGGHRLAAIPVAEIPPFLLRQVVPFEEGDAPGSIVIRADHRLLYLVLPDGYALRYGIGVGREGLGWTGAAAVYRKARWPSWRPTPAMIARDPSLQRWAEGQPGGPANPLGARAHYLRSNGVDEGIRIHGTPEWRSIGRAASSGCFRMLQHEVIDLFDRVPIGTRVVVRDGAPAATG